MRNIIKLTIGLALMLVLASGFTRPAETEDNINITSEEGMISDIKATLASQEVTPEEVNKVADDLYRFVGYCTDEELTLRVEGDIDTSDESWDITWATLMLINEDGSRELLATYNADTDTDWNVTDAGTEILNR